MGSMSRPNSSTVAEADNQTEDEQGEQNQPPRAHQQQQQQQQPTLTQIMSQANGASIFEDVNASDPKESPFYSMMQTMLENEDHDDGRVAGYIAEYVEMNNHFIGREDDEHLLVYHPDQGIYDYDGRPRLREYLSDRLSRTHYDNTISNKVEQKIIPYNYIRSVDIGAVEEKMCVENGMLDLSDPQEPKLEDHSPEHPLTSHLPVEYDPDAECPEWRAFVEEVVPDEGDRQTLQEFAGYCLQHWNCDLKRALLLLGPTDSGKSTFLKVLRGVFGGDNVANVSVQGFGKKYQTATLPGSIVNIRNDLDSSIVYNTGMIKEVIAGDTVKVRQIYGEPFDYTPTQKHLFAANQVPEIEDADNAFYNRWLHVEFPNSVPDDEQVDGYHRQLLDEASGILNWMLEGYARLMANDEGFTVDPPVEQKRQLWQSYGDSVDRFAGECVDYNPGYEADEQAVYNRYVGFCQDNGLPAQEKAELTKALKKQGVAQTRLGPRGDRTRCYKGVIVDGVPPFGGKMVPPGPDEQGPPSSNEEEI